MKDYSGNISFKKCVGYMSLQYKELSQVEKQLDFRAEREGRDKKERDEKKRAFKNLVSRQYWR